MVPHALHLVLTADPSAGIDRQAFSRRKPHCGRGCRGHRSAALIALTKFRGREFVIVVLNALMGLPPVIVGLLVYVSLSRSGPLGSWGWLFTAKAMVIAQAILVLPILTALTNRTIDARTNRGDVCDAIQYAISEHFLASSRSWNTIDVRKLLESLTCAS
jgi:tungstate transport system permease protein